jgi:hypothetical protein
MPEQLTDQHLEDLFADLRSSELRQIRPPGVAAARNAVRRRRTAQSFAAAAAVLAVAGGIAGVGIYRTAGTPGTVDLGPELSDAELTFHAKTAADAIGWDPEKKGIAAQEVLSGGYATATDALAGTYDLAMSCVGRGTVVVVARAIAADVAGEATSIDEQTELQRTTVPCDLTPAARSISFTVPWTGFLTIDITPDDAATGRSGFAYRAELTTAEKLRIQTSLAESVKTANPSTVSSMSGFVSSGITDVDGTASAGSYRITIACLGAGSIDVVTTIDPKGVAKPTELGKRKVTCGASPTTASFTMSAGALSVHLKPDQYALGNSFAAYQLEKI